MVAGEVKFAEVRAAARVGIGDGEVGVDGVYLVGFMMVLLLLLLLLVMAVLLLMLSMVLCLVLILGRGMVGVLRGDTPMRRMCT